MHWAQSLYRWVPAPAKALLLNAKAASNYRKRYRSPYRKLLDQHKRLWNADLDEVQEYQRQQLILILLEAYDHSPWYKRQFDELGVQRDEILVAPFEVLSRMPWLSKRERKVNLDDLISRNPKRKISNVGYTSGSTGEPTRVVGDRETAPTIFAYLERYYWSIGLTERRRSVRLSGRHVVNLDRKSPPFWMYNWLDRQLLVSTYHLNDAHLPTIIDKLNRFEPEFIDGYPSAAYVIAQYILKHNVQLAFTPIAISSTAETLYPFQREVIEQAFGCKVYNQYASGEGSPFITECRAGKLHLHLDTGVFEFVNNRGVPAEPGEMAEMVVTSFRNLLVPLIRYRIGDMVQLCREQEQCPCGCSMPTIESILGRDDDLTVTTSGALIGLATHRIFTGEDCIVRGQVVQPSPGAIILRYVPDHGHRPEVSVKLISKTKSIFGEDMDVVVQLVDDIPLGANGKYRSVIRQFSL